MKYVVFRLLLNWFQYGLLYTFWHLYIYFVTKDTIIQFAKATNGVFQHKRNAHWIQDQNRKKKPKLYYFLIIVAIMVNLKTAPGPSIRIHV